MTEDKLPEAEQSKWVRFDEEGGAAGTTASAPATIDVQDETDSTAAAAAEPTKHVVKSPAAPSVSARTVAASVNGVRSEAPRSATSLQDVSLADQPPPPPANNIRQGFENGDVIVTLLPLNTKLPWLTPAQFRPELVPEELMAQGLTLTVEEYVQGMELLVNDVRFNAYNICYKRILVGWILLGFIVLITILFAAKPGLQLFGCGVIWLIINAVAIFLCMWIKIKLNRELERCVALVNRVFSKHDILVGVDDRGRLSCHKVNLCFIYFRTQDCVKKLQEIVEREELSSTTEDLEARLRSQRMQQRMDIDSSDIIITGSQNTRLSRKQDRAWLLLFRYSQRWVKHHSRGYLELSINPRDPTSGGPPLPPRHWRRGRCPCQFIQEHLEYKLKGTFCQKLAAICGPEFGFD